ncbi:DUF4065 domain-containing protein [Micrococcales bacterium 31B]|nr:DUF4065 domain-containing protein [Micrococcales bacterium 31B]
MATALDVAAYIVSKKGAMSAMKLQKLVYYAQAWNLAWDDRPLFQDVIQAWARGPVVPSLFALHKGKFTITEDTVKAGQADRLDADEVDTVEAVLETYGDLSAAQLSALTHAEDPWNFARVGVNEEAKSLTIISHESMRTYYNTLSASPDAVFDVADVNFPPWLAMAPGK